MTPTEQPEDLRTATITAIEDVVVHTLEFRAKEDIPALADNILRLCEAAVLAALPKKRRQPKLGGSMCKDWLIGHNIAVATAQANIHSVFGGKTSE
jgi:hypothetical protein